MAVDMNSIPPALETVNVDNASSADVWLEAGTHTGILTGRYLLKSKLEVQDAKDLGITDAKILDEGATDKQLKFTFITTKPIPSDTMLTFRLSKEVITNEKTRALYSAPFVLKATFRAGDVQITDVSRTGDTVSIKGSGFLDPGDKSFHVSLKPDSGPEVPLKSGALSRKPSQIDVDLAKLDTKLQPGCYRPIVETAGGPRAVSGKAFP